MSRYNLDYDDYFDRNECYDDCRYRGLWNKHCCYYCIGPTGPVGTILGSYGSIAELTAAHPTGNQGDTYLVGGELYVWNEENQQWENVGNIQGPTGSVGTILGSYGSLAEFTAAHPTGNQGDAYLVGGELYVWDTAASTWRSVGNLIGPTGAQGIAGSTGPTGPQGEAATISGYYEDYNAFIAEHPTGTEGEMYIVDGTLYIWDEATRQWKELGSLIGPTGPQGEAATISGYYEDYNTFIAEHPTGTEGEMYIVDGILYIWDEATRQWRELGSLIGPTGSAGTSILDSYDTYNEFIGEHPTGTEGDAYLVGGELYVWHQDTGWQNMGSLIGPTGPAGPVGTILDSYDTLAELIQEHPTGNQGDSYLVGGVLYVWDTDNNSWRAVGNLCPACEAVTIIPFASQVAPRTYVNGGVPSRVSLIGFGYGDRRDDITDLYSFAVNSDNTFVLEGANDNFQIVFSLPFDMIIKSIALTTGNWAEYSPSGTVYPYVQLYAAAPTSNNFAPIEGAAAIPETGHNAGLIPSNTMLYALRENLDVRLRAGTRIAIGGLARIEGDTAARDYYLYFTGGIGMTRWIE